MNVTGIWGVFSLTFRESIRAKWLILFAAIFFLLAIDIPDLLGSLNHAIPENYLITFLGTLASLSFPVIPLLSLPMGATSIVDERESGTLQYILSNPISKTEFFLGRATGLLVATTAAVLIGFGLASVASYGTQFSQYSAMSWVILYALVLNAIMLGVGFLISEFSKRKVTAIVVAIFVWLFLTVLSNVEDLVIILNATYGEFPAVALSLLDPIEVTRLLTVFALGEGAAYWGTLGIFAYDFFQKSLVPVLLATAAVWLIGLYGLAFLIFRHQDQG